MKKHYESIGKSDEWYTPPEVFEALGCNFDLDVSSPRTKTFVPSKNFIYENSLLCEWNGFIWMNPPYGARNSLDAWMNKFLSHGNGIALTPDRTSAPWFFDNFNRVDLILFTKKIKFINEKGDRGLSPSNGSALWAIGNKGCKSLLNAQKRNFGILAKPFI